MAFFSKIPKKYLAEIQEKAYHEQLIKVIVELQKRIEALEKRVTELEI